MSYLLDAFVLWSIAVLAYVAGIATAVWFGWTRAKDPPKIITPPQ